MTWLWKMSIFKTTTTGVDQIVLCKLVFRTDPKPGVRNLGSWFKPGFHASIWANTALAVKQPNRNGWEWTCQETQGHSSLHSLCRSNSALDKSLSRENGHGARSSYLFSSLTGREKKNSTSKQGHMTLAGASSLGCSSESWMGKLHRMETHR